MRKLHKESNIDEESLVLFRELHHRANTSLLLQPVSNEFESDIGNTAAYRIGSASAKKSLGHEFLRDISKNDYDWLKTPPATPLFPSLEMDAAGHARELVVQRELPIVQPLSRFAETVKGSGGATKDYCIWKAHNPTTKPTPTHQRPIITRIKPEHKPKPMPAAPAVNQKPTRQTAQVRSQTPMLEQDKPPSPRVGPTTNKLGPALHSGRPRLGLSSNLYETPSNLKRSDPRPTSTLRGRPRNPSVSKSSMEAQSSVTTRRQSTSPSMARVWKQGNSQVEMESASGDVNQKGKLGQGGGKVFGSSMVDRMMKARRTADSDQKRPNENPITNSSADKNMVIRTGRFNSHITNTVTTRSSSRPRGSCK